MRAALNVILSVGARPTHAGNRYDLLPPGLLGFAPTRFVVLPGSGVRFPRRCAVLFCFVGVLVGARRLRLCLPGVGSPLWAGSVQVNPRRATTTRAPAVRTPLVLSVDRLYYRLCVRPSSRGPAAARIAGPRAQARPGRGRPRGASGGARAVMRGGRGLRPGPRHPARLCVWLSWLCVGPGVAGPGSGHARPAVYQR